jgi:hypothetical protein
VTLEFLPQVLMEPQQEAAWDRRDPEGVAAMSRLLEAGFVRLHERDAKLASQHLPLAFRTLVPLVSSLFPDD